MLGEVAKCSVAHVSWGRDNEKAKRRKYTPFRVEDDDELPEGYVNPMSQTYGTDKDIAPAPRRDDGWDPRQW